MRAVIGISEHSGWAVFVSVAARDGEPDVIDRRRVELLAPGLPNQPFHHETLAMDPARAEELVKKVRRSAAVCAELALRQVCSDLGGAEIAGIAVREGPLPSMPSSVAEAHSSYVMTTRADGMLYHDALCRAASAIGLAVEEFANGQERARAAQALGCGTDRLERWLSGFRDRLGPPWQKDHRDATARAIAALGKRGLT